MQNKPRNHRNIQRKTPRDTGRGRREKDTAPAAPKPPAQPATTQAPNTQINITHLRIGPCKNKVLLFPEREPIKNRRFTAWEWEQEKIDALFLKRPQRHFFRDPPTYPYCVPEPIVNFDLGFKQ